MSDKSEETTNCIQSEILTHFSEKLKITDVLSFGCGIGSCFFFFFFGLLFITGSTGAQVDFHSEAFENTLSLLTPRVWQKLTKSWCGESGGSSHQNAVDGRVMSAVCARKWTHPARCFLDLSEMPSRDMSLLNTTIPMSIFTWERQKRENAWAAKRNHIVWFCSKVPRHAKKLNHPTNSKIVFFLLPLESNLTRDQC